MLTLGDVIEVFYFFVIFYIGTIYPNIDFRIRVIRHRSILTHSPLLPFLLLKAFDPNRLVDLFVIALSAGIGVHLAFDLYTKEWKSIDLISVPFLGRAKKKFSKLLIFLSGTLSLSLAFSIANGLREFSMILIALFLVFYMYSKSKEEFWKPLLTIFFYITAIFVLRYIKN